MRRLLILYLLLFAGCDLFDDDDGVSARLPLRGTGQVLPRPYGPYDIAGARGTVAFEETADSLIADVAIENVPAGLRVGLFLRLRADRWESLVPKARLDSTVYFGPWLRGPFFSAGLDRRAWYRAAIPRAALPADARYVSAWINRTDVNASFLVSPSRPLLPR